MIGRYLAYLDGWVRSPGALWNATSAMAGRDFFVAASVESCGYVVMDSI